MPAPGVEAGYVVSAGDREQLLAAGHAAVQQLRTATDEGIRDIVQRVEVLTGETILVRRPGVLDATWDDLWRMSWQASNFEAAMLLLKPLMEAAPGKTLGAALKTADPFLVRDVRRHLVEAGVLPVEEAPDGSAGG